MALDSNFIRLENLELFFGQPLDSINFNENWDDLGTSGIIGDPTKASIEYGKKGLEFKINAALNQIQKVLNHK